MKRPELCRAIKTKNRIQFVYHNKFRKGEPQCYGISKRGNEALRVYLVEGGREHEQLFIVDEIESLRILQEIFLKPGPNFKKGDKDMITIFCELDD